MAYRYPDSLQLDRTPSASEYPCGWIREMRSLRWQSYGMHEGHYIYMKLTFGGKSALSLPWFSTTFKNLECDRQIGDRRGRNSVEGRVSGPSKACLQAQTF